MDFRDLPIRQKLRRAILTSCTIALCLMSGAYIFFQYYTSKQNEQSKVATLALVISSNSSGALAFQNTNEATEILNALRADKEIVAACIYDHAGHIFAVYPEGLNKKTLPSKIGTGYAFNGSYIEGFVPIKQQGMLLGHFYIKSSMNVLYKQVRFNIFTALLLIGITLLVGYVLSEVYQKSISKPIHALEKVAKNISDGGDYSIRAHKIGNDEIGSLTDAFNVMLDQIKLKSDQLLTANLESSKLASIVESSGDAIIGCTDHMVINSWNTSAERIIGYSADEVIGKPISDIFHATEIDHQEVIQRLKQGEQFEWLETQIVSKGGKRIDISLTISPVRDSGGQIVGISQIARDITEHKKKELQIVQNEEHLRLATTAAELGTFNLDLTVGSMTWDARCRELFGIFNDEPVSFEESFLNGLHEDDRERVSKIIKNAFDKKISNGNYDVEYRTIGKTDKQLRWVKAKGKVFFDEHDTPVRFIGSVLDISKQKQDEERKNDFIAIVSHELKTPLTTIKAYVQMVLAKAKKEGNTYVVNALAKADTQTGKMSSMLKDFLNLARLEEGELLLSYENFDLGQLLKDVMAEAELLNSSHPIKLMSCDHITVNGDRDKLEQVLTNLISNASKYSASGSPIEVGCSKEGSRIKVFVKDYGVGINIEHQKKLFNRFYRVQSERTKTVSGFGIGLYLVSEILRFHNSRIEVESVAGVGSEFYFYLDTDHNNLSA